jgi:tRNA (guanine37-N1)-methyltransferase
MVSSSVELDPAGIDPAGIDPAVLESARLESAKLESAKPDRVNAAGERGDACEPAPLRIAVISLFPELFRTFLEISFVGRALSLGLVEVTLIQLRDFGLGNHRSVDDTPYGGGAGMVIRVDCVVAAIEAAEACLGGRAHRVLMTPQGTPHSAALARSLAPLERLVLVCGRYEGFDERVRSFVDQEISLGDFVLTGGEIPAMAVIESAIRFRPGVLGSEDSVREESFSDALDGGLEYPHYTRPAEFQGLSVPDVLKSGDHRRIDEYRRAASLERTQMRRPELLIARQKSNESKKGER